MTDSQRLWWDGSVLGRDTPHVGLVEGIAQGDRHRPLHGVEEGEEGAHPDGRVEGDTVARAMPGTHGVLGMVKIICPIGLKTGSTVKMGQVLDVHQLQYQRAGSKISAT